MAKIFISYSRDSQDVVEELVQDLNDDDHETWFDQRLTGAGGQKWWDTILSEIRKCDIFVAALTPDSLESLACQRELKYADGLQKPLCPVRLSDKVRPEALPHRLAELQWVDYCHRDKLAFKNLQRTIRELPKAPTLPDPLPDEPPVPISYLNTLRERIETDSPLEFKDQAQLVFELRRSFRDGGAAEEITDLLRRLKKRDELFAKVARDIEELQRDINRGAVSRTINRELVMAVAAKLGSLDRTWYTPDIPEDKANNARASMKIPADESMLVLFDGTLFGSAKGGLLIGVKGLYYKPQWGSPEYASWDEFLANPVQVENTSLGTKSVKVAGRSWGFRAGIGARVLIFVMKLRARALDDL